MILSSGIIHRNWVTGLIVPIYTKNGDIEVCNNYQGITPLSCFGKLSTNTLNVRLYKFCEDNSILKENQTDVVDHV